MNVHVTINVKKYTERFLDEKKKLQALIKNALGIHVIETDVVKILLFQQFFSSLYLGLLVVSLGNC